ncbi:MAG: putative exported protein [Cenarchaeum symbiont of Oopsacas minuta]|nr:putative exported protein [Cenarchaeum symbiont of Oopsacas minuta]
MYILVFVMLISTYVHYALAEEIVFHTDNAVYSPGDPLLVYGTAHDDDPLIIRLFAPDGTIKGFEQITADMDGTFNHILLMWPEPSTAFPYGTYAIEVLSTTNEGILGTIDIRFGPHDGDDITISRDATVLVYAPESAAVGSPIRLFVQTTSDGLLIGDDPKDLLSTTHVHLPDGAVDDISTNFISLHRGLYYIDYTPKTLGTYVFHAVMFYEGTVSHGSTATIVLGQDIGGISNQIVALNTILDDTAEELDRLKQEVSKFGSTLENADTKIESSVGSITSSVGNIEEASIQLNSLLFPIVASISIIVALQIVILARRR